MIKDNENLEIYEVEQPGKISGKLFQLNKL
jgi:hypothetical protein